METEGKKTLGFCPACISSPGGGRGRKENQQNERRIIGDYVILFLTWTIYKTIACTSLSYGILLTENGVLVSLDTIVKKDYSIQCLSFTNTN